MDRFLSTNERSNYPPTGDRPLHVLSDDSSTSTTPFANDDRLGSFASSTSFRDNHNSSLRGSFADSSAQLLPMAAPPTEPPPSFAARKEAETRKGSKPSGNLSAVAERSDSHGTCNSGDDEGGGEHNDTKSRSTCQCVCIARKGPPWCNGLVVLPFYLPQEWREPMAKAAEALRHPIAIATLVMIGMLTVSGALLFFTLTGMWKAFGGTEEKLWFEFSNQVLNGVCTLSCLVMHPLRCYYVVRLIRWSPIDVASLRALLSAAGAFVAKPNERRHMAVVLTLLQLNCIFQYAIEVILWTIPEPQRPVPLIAFLVCIALGSPFTAGLYCIFSPLGWATADPPVRKSFRSFGRSSAGSQKSVSESQRSAGESQGAKATPCPLCDGVLAGEGKMEVVVVAEGQAHGDAGKQRTGVVRGEEQQCAVTEELPLAEGGKLPARRRFGEYEEIVAQEGERTLQEPKQWRIPVWRPDGERREWQGSVFDCCTGGWCSAVSATLCCFCVHARHVERAGFGNWIVHTAMFIFFLFGPIVIFTMGARNTPNGVMQWFVFSLGVLGSVLGATYGGYWRWKVRRTFLLPEQEWCCGHKALTDFAAWYVLPCCSLCQEMRTVRHYSLHMLVHLPDQGGEERGTGGQGQGQGKESKVEGAVNGCQGCRAGKAMEGGAREAAMLAPVCVTMEEGGMR